MSKNIGISEAAAIDDKRQKLVNEGDVTAGLNEKEKRSDTINRKIRKKIFHNAVVLKYKLDADAPLSIEDRKVQIK